MKKRWVWLVIVTMVVFVPLSFFLSYRNSMAADVAALRKQNVPTSYAELDAMLKKDEPNAGPIYENVSSILRLTQKGGLDTLEKFSVGWIPFDDRVRRAYGNLSQQLKETRDASKMPYCYYHPAPVSPGLIGTRSLKPYIDQFGVGSLLAYSADVESAMGKPKEANDDIAALIRKAGQMRQSPGFLPFLQTGNGYHRAIDAWIKCLDKHRDRESVLESLEVVKDPPPTPSIHWMLATDAPEVFEQMRYGAEHPQEFVKALSIPHPNDPFLNNSLAIRYAMSQLIHARRVVIEGTSDDPEKWEDAKKLLEKEHKKLDAMWPIKQYNMDSHGVFAEVCETIPSMVAEQRMAKTSANLMLYHLDHGAFPASLPLSGVDTTDPFDKKPLRYRKQGKGFVIWSVGMDMKDDGGKMTPRRLSTKLDIVMGFD